MSYQSIWIGQRDVILAAAERVKQANPVAWAEVTVPGQQSRWFISLVAAECQKTVSVDIGCNLKRGGPETSLDVLAMPNDTGCVDATGTYDGLELIDIINGAEGPNPSITWGDATPATIAAGVPGGWIKSAETVTPPAPSPCPTQPYPDEPTWWNGYTAEVKKRYPGGVLNDEAFRWFTRCAYDIGAGMPKDLSAAKHLAELDAPRAPVALVGGQS